jgi:hypothetical protein
VIPCRPATFDIASILETLELDCSVAISVVQIALPPQLRDLSSKAQFLPEALRDALQVTLSVAPSDATPEQVLVDTFARLGYLPDEAKQSALKILAEAEDKA